MWAKRYVNVNVNLQQSTLLCHCLNVLQHALLSGPDPWWVLMLCVCSSTDTSNFLSAFLTDVRITYSHHICVDNTSSPAGFLQWWRIMLLTESGSPWVTPTWSAHSLPVCLCCLETGCGVRGVTTRKTVKAAQYAGDRGQWTILGSNWGRPRIGGHADVLMNWI